MSSAIQTAFSNIRSASGTGSEPGYYATDRYPEALQAEELPLVAPGGRGGMLGANQAFFFVDNPYGNEDPASIRFNIDHLKKLMGNVYDQGVQFTLAMDADVLQNPAAFVSKYEKLRPESDPALRQAMVVREAGMIAGFIAADGVRHVARQVVQEKSGATGQRLEELTGRFLEEQFHLAGVQVQQPLTEAVWQMDGPGGGLYAKQAYTPGMHTTERAWQVGTQPELSALAEAGHPGAQSIMNAVANMQQMQAVDLMPAFANRQRSSGGGRGL